MIAFWQEHRDAGGYSSLALHWAQPGAGMAAWDPGGDAVGHSGWVLAIDIASAASRAARAVLVDLHAVDAITDSVRRVLAVRQVGAGVSVLEAS
ncbi:hypothetical protein ABFA25_11455 [Mycobacterium lepromatosis]|nr:hypothetical protein [Mycobacterium lepromatosis]